MEIIEIIDPELAMCLEGEGFPYHYVRKEGRLEIIAFVMTDAFSEAFCELDEDEGCSIYRFVEVDDPVAQTVIPGMEGTNQRNRGGSA